MASVSSLSSELLTLSLFFSPFYVSAFCSSVSGIILESKGANKTVEETTRFQIKSQKEYRFSGALSETCVQLNVIT